MNKWKYLENKDRLDNMDTNNNEIDDLINTFTEQPELVDNLTDEQVEYLTKYLEAKIKEKEEFLKSKEEA